MDGARGIGPYSHLRSCVNSLMVSLRDEGKLLAEGGGGRDPEIAVATIQNSGATYLRHCDSPTLRVIRMWKYRKTGMPEDWDKILL